MQEDGFTFRFEKNQYKLIVLDASDEIVFQLRDARGQVAALRNIANIYGEFKVPCSDLMVNDGKTFEYPFTYKPYGDHKEVEGGTLLLLPKYTNDFKKDDKAYGFSRDAQ